MVGGGWWWWMGINKCIYILIYNISGWWWCGGWLYVVGGEGVWLVVGVGDCCGECGRWCVV